MPFPNYKMQNTKEILLTIQQYKCDDCGLDEFRILEVRDLPLNTTLRRIGEKVKEIQEMLEG
jgi:hypothetical protein